MVRCKSVILLFFISPTCSLFSFSSFYALFWINEVLLLKYFYYSILPFLLACNNISLLYFSGCFKGYSTDLYYITVYLHVDLWFPSLLEKFQALFVQMCFLSPLSPFCGTTSLFILGCSKLSHSSLIFKVFSLSSLIVLVCMLSL